MFDKSKNSHKVLVIALGIVGALVILASTSKYGPGLSPISGDYFSAAENLVRQHSFVQHDGSPYVLYPPFLPMLLAVTFVAKIDPAAVMRYLNAILFALIVIFSANWFRRNVRFLSLELFGTLSMLISIPIIGVSIFAWPETLFIFCIILFLLQIENFLRKEQASSLYLAAIFAALASLTRYIGVSVTITGIFLLLLYRRKPLRRFFREMFIFGGIAALPLFLWLIRNYYVTDSLTGERGISSFPLSQNIRSILDILTGWFLPSYWISFPLRMGFLGIFLGISVVTAVIGWNKSRERLKEDKAAAVLPSIIFVLVYLSMLLIAASTVALDRIGSRFLCPIYPSLIFIIILILDAARSALTKRSGARIAAYAISFALIIWLAYHGRIVLRKVRYYVRNGTGRYASVSWRSSPLIKYLSDKPNLDDVYSNEAYAVYMLTGIPAKSSPRKYLFNSPRSKAHDLPMFKKELDKKKIVHLVWFDTVKRDYLYGIEELNSFFDMRVVSEHLDGKIYEVREPQ